MTPFHLLYPPQPYSFFPVPEGVWAWSPPRLRNERGGRGRAPTRRSRTREATALDRGSFLTPARRMTQQDRRVLDTLTGCCLFQPELLSDPVCLVLPAGPAEAAAPPVPGGQRLRGRGGPPGARPHSDGSEFNRAQSFRVLVLPPASSTLWRPEENQAFFS